jgi:DNA-binding PadR family transcriptional regulator
MSLRFVLLALLARRQDTGYGLGRLLRTELRHVWQASHQQIYPELAHLVTDRLVDVEVEELPNRPNKKLYSLAPAGELALRRWIALKPRASHRDELLPRLLCLGLVGADVLLERIKERLAERSTQLAELEPLLASVPSGNASVGELLALEAELYRVRAEVAWCQRAQSLLSEGDNPPESRPRRAGKE